MQPAVVIADLSKRYRIGGHGPEGLRHAIDRAVGSALQGLRRGADPERRALAAAQDFWALRDVSLQIPSGDVVGVIGRNGAGKTTLLKIVSRITEPTSGRVTLRGRVASLLEVGTGFHPELTGRENVFLNGAILGMPKAEVKRKFEQIVAFAEIDRFLDTPVKRYSSGMYMRLAFAVAAHLEPDILIVDEVLAVGDAAFQKKCLGKMELVAGEGRTVIFVSHNMAAIQRLCRSCVLLEAGRLVAEGPAPDVVREYLARVDAAAVQPSASGDGQCHVAIRVLDAAGKPTSVWGPGQTLHVEVTVAAERALRRPAVDLAFYADRRTRLFAVRSDEGRETPDRIDGPWTVEFAVKNPGLAIAEMYFDLGVREGTDAYIWLLRDAGRLTADFQALPDSARGDALLHVETTVRLTRGRAVVNEAVH